MLRYCVGQQKNLLTDGLVQVMWAVKIMDYVEINFNVKSAKTKTQSDKSSMLFFFSKLLIGVRLFVLIAFIVL